jgi:hypothetical protein
LQKKSMTAICCHRFVLPTIRLTRPSQYLTSRRPLSPRRTSRAGPPVVHIATVSSRVCVELGDIPADSNYTITLKGEVDDGVPSSPSPSSPSSPFSLRLPSAAFTSVEPSRVCQASVPVDQQNAWLTLRARPWRSLSAHISSCGQEGDETAAAADIRYDGNFHPSSRSLSSLVPTLPLCLLCPAVNNRQKGEKRERERERD